MSGYTIIDVDTHETETFDAWTSRVLDTLKDRVPRIDLDAKGRHRPVMQGQGHARHQALAHPIQQPETTQQEDRYARQGEQGGMARTRQHPVINL